MVNEVHMLMSASGNTFCEVSVIHMRTVHAVAWIEFPTEGKKLACGECADVVHEQRIGTVMRDLRNGNMVECDDCGREYRGNAYHNCRNVAGEPFVVKNDEGTVKS